AMDRGATSRQFVFAQIFRSILDIYLALKVCDQHASTSTNVELRLAQKAQDTFKKIFWSIYPDLEVDERSSSFTQRRQNSSVLVRSIFTFTMEGDSSWKITHTIEALLVFLGDMTHASKHVDNPKGEGIVAFQPEAWATLGNLATILSTQSMRGATQQIGIAQLLFISSMFLWQDPKNNLLIITQQQILNIMHAKIPQPLHPQQAAAESMGVL
ncbi:hypothetical protein ACJX0J_033981, partial [Zea mays]